MSGQRLLGLAEAVLERTAKTSPALRVRLAAWYTRAALEDFSINLLRPHIGADPESLTMKSRLICLRSLVPTVGEAASYAWWALSRVCHYHAFELTPTQGEIEHLIALVRQVDPSGR